MSFVFHFSKKGGGETLEIRNNLCKFPQEKIELFCLFSDIASHSGSSIHAWQLLENLCIFAGMGIHGFRNLGISKQMLRPRSH